MIEEKAFQIKDELISIRRHLHRTPETDFEEIKTSSFIRSKLDDYGIPYTTSAKTGTVALIKGKNSNKTVLLRADIDGLPIKDESKFEIKSEREGYMHACGHDIHATCLLGAAKILNDIKDELNGNVKLVFQPAEEGVGGALPMIEDGILENPHVDAAFALHVEPLEKTGNIQVKDGSIMASPDDFKIVVHGVGGHASAPEKCVNPVTIGTARSLDNETREMLIELLDKTAHETAKKHGTTIDFTFNKLFPPVVNNSEMNDVIRNSAKKLTCINEVVTLDKPAMAGDDFSYFGENVPSAYFKLGVGNVEKGAVYPIHSPKFIADEDALPIGSAILSQTAVDYLDTYNN